MQVLIMKKKLRFLVLCFGFAICYMAEVNQNSTVLTPKINRHKQPNKNSSAPFNLSFTKPSPVSFKQPRPLLSPKYTHQSPKQGSNVISTPNRKQHSFSNPSPKSAVKAASKPKKVLFKHSKETQFNSNSLIDSYRIGVPWI